MISIVTGVGPRVGTSYIMNEARKAGLPIMGKKHLKGLTIKKHNPSGYWELDPYIIPQLAATNSFDGYIIKMWSQGLKLLDPNSIGAAVIIERKDKQAQLNSMYKVWKDEIKTKVGSLFSDLSVETIYNNHLEALNNYKFNSILHVYTEDLTSRTKEILNYLERGL